MILTISKNPTIILWEKLPCFSHRMKGYSLLELLAVGLCIITLVALGWLAAGKARETIIWTWRQATQSNWRNIEMPAENSEHGLGPSLPDQ
jgi:hypothetical protein